MKWLHKDPRFIRTTCSRSGLDGQWPGYLAKLRSVFVASFMESCLPLPREDDDISLALVQGARPLEGMPSPPFLLHPPVFDCFLSKQSIIPVLWQREIYGHALDVCIFWTEWPLEAP